MNTTAKIIIGVSVLGLTGVGLYLFFKNKKDKSAASGSNTTIGSSSLAGSSVSQIPTTQSNTQPISNQSASIPTNKPSIPLPANLSAEEMDAVKNFCSLPDGKSMNFLKINLDLKTKWGIANSFYYKHFNGNIGMTNANVGMKAVDYFNGLKKYFGCP